MEERMAALEALVKEAIEDLSDRVDALEERMRGLASVSREAREKILSKLDDIQPPASGGFTRQAVKALQAKMEVFEAAGPVGDSSSLKSRIEELEKQIAASGSTADCGYDHQKFMLVAREVVSLKKASIRREDS